MTTTIALAGKGGVGKTTVSAMVVKYLIKQGHKPILAIDADPSSNLNMVLGLDLEWTVGDIREDMLAQVKESLTAGGAAMGAMQGGVSKREYLDFEIRSSMAEGDNVDLIAMGRSEGPGCYCAVNHNLRDVIDGMSKHYRYVVIDNEAGMEHLSRRTTRDVQVMLVVTDPTQRGVVAAQRIGALRDELDINVEQAYLILNGLRSEEIPAPLAAKIEETGLPLLGTVPYNDELTTYEFDGRPLVDLPDDSPVYLAVEAMLKQALSNV